MDSNDTHQLIDFLGDRILDAKYTEIIGRNMTDILPLIVTKKFTYNHEDDEIIHKSKCIALAKLLRFSSEIRRFV